MVDRNLESYCRVGYSQNKDYLEDSANMADNGSFDYKRSATNHS